MTRQTVFEALWLITASIVLGFAYTFITKQGFFSEKKQAPAARAGLEMISLVKAREMLESGNALFIDARHEFEYKSGHIRGAINIPQKEFETQRRLAKDIPVNKMLIVYCDGAECNSSIELAVKLVEAGYTNVNVFFGGWQEWLSANLPVEK